MTLARLQLHRTVRRLRDAPDGGNPHRVREVQVAVGIAFVQLLRNVADLYIEGRDEQIEIHSPGTTRRLHDRVDFAKLKETARGQAYEVFSLRRFVEQTGRLYENAMSGAAADAEITDPAMVG